MKLSLQWMQQLAEGNQLPINDEHLIKKIGSQLGEVTEVVDLSLIYKDAVIVKVVSAKPLENSDHLNLCLIDDGRVVKDVDRQDDELIQVVCGAPNVAASQLVVWLPPASTVPASAGKDPFVLSTRKIMGVISNGMLASARELAIGDDHDGIVVINEDVEPGTKLADYLHLNDQIVDIENKMFTHRPDLFGQLGIARELAAIYGQAFFSPDWYVQDAVLETESDYKLKVTNKLTTDGCPRFMAVAIDNLKVEASPLWLQSYLSRCGVRPINNIVDVTNYVMLATSQPMHAYDLAKIANDDGAEIVVRHPVANETLQLLDGSEIKLLPKDVVIANSERAIGLGGIMGGHDSEVSATTTKIVLECASFDMYSIRRSAMAHGIFSEAVTRFTKGQSPYQCPAIMSYAVSLLKQLCPEATVISELADESNDLKPLSEIGVELKLLNTYLGYDIDPNDAAALLNNAELDARIDGTRLLIKPPFWRTDLAAEEDIIEEVARLVGYDNLPMTLPLRRIAPSIVPPLVELKREVEAILSSAGANELLTYSFVDAKLMKDSGQEVERAFKLANALSPELEYYRTALLPSLLKQVHPNHKNGYGKLALFEMGKVHFSDLFDDQGMPSEFERLAFVVSADDKSAKASYEGPAYYMARKYLDYLMISLGLDTDKLTFKAIDDLSKLPEWSMYPGLSYKGRSAMIGYADEVVGVIGEIAKQTSRLLKLPEFCAAFELSLDTLVRLRSKSTSPYKQLSRFPSLTQDLTVARPVSISYGVVYDQLVARLAELVDKDMSAKLTLIDIFQTDDQCHWTFRLNVSSDQRTLTDLEVTKLVEALKSNV